MISFVLSAHPAAPAYLQLAQQVKNAIRTGLLQPGDKLPTAKEVVGALGLNPNTVFKAYHELERDGLVTSRPGAGTFVHRNLGSASPETCDQLLQKLLEWITSAEIAGLDADDIRALFAAAEELPAVTRPA